MKKLLFLLVCGLMVVGMVMAKEGPSSNEERGIEPEVVFFEPPIVNLDVADQDEVLFDVEGIEITDQSVLQEIQGAREVVDNPNEGRYTERVKDRLEREWENSVRADRNEARNAKIERVLANIKTILNNVGIEVSLIGASVVVMSNQVRPDPATGEAILKASTLAAGGAITFIGLGLKYVADKIPDYSSRWNGRDDR